MIQLDQKKVGAKLKDRWWRLNHLYKIRDKHKKIVTFQPNFVQTIIDDNLGWLNLILKSRQHGVTTYSCIRALDSALFQSNFRGGIIAHNKQDAEAFFRDKVKFAYDMLPAWLQEQKPIIRDGGGVLEIGEPKKSSIVSVSTSFRGGTLDFLHISEYGPMWAKYPDKAQEVKTGALNTVHEGAMVVIESTAMGTEGDFYIKCKRAMELDRLIRAGTAELSDRDYKFFFFPWYVDVANRMNPHGVVVSRELESYFGKLEVSAGVELTTGQRAWYVKKQEEQTSDMFSEHPSTAEEAFQASIVGAYYATEMAKAEKDGRVLDLPLNPMAPVYTYWDIGVSDSTAIWFVQKNGPWFDHVDYYENSGESVDHYIAKLLELREERGFTIYGTCFLPHDGANTDWSSSGNKPRDQYLREAGFKVEVLPRVENLQQGIDWTRTHITRCRFDRKFCGPDENDRGGLPSLKNYRKKWNEQQECFHDRPLKNWAVHGADAFRQEAQAYQEDRGVQTGTSRRRKKVMERMDWRHV